MRAAILTDMETVADLVASEHFEVKPLAGETIELFQRDGNSVTSLLRTPANAPAIRFMAGAGTRLENVGVALHVIVTAEVERLKDGLGYKPTISGSLALSEPIALDDVRTKLAAVALSASITGAGKTPLVVLPVAPGSAGAPLHATIHPNPEWFADLTLVASPRTIHAHQSWIMPVRILGFALAALLFVFSARIAAGTRRSPRPRAGDGDEAQRRGIHAVAQAGRRGPSSNTWPRCESPSLATELRCASCRASRVFVESSPARWLGEARPAGAGVELVERAEQRLAGDDVDVDAGLVVVPVLIVERRLGASCCVTSYWLG